MRGVFDHSSTQRTETIAQVGKHTHRMTGRAKEAERRLWKKFSYGEARFYANESPTKAEIHR